MTGTIRERYSRDVFVNCPFDEAYRPLRDAIFFAITDCGFQVRCALEVEDSGEVRAAKILRIIEECRLGIHDISRTELDAKVRLPRFNMPFELGEFLGAQRFGGARHRQKRCLVLDKDAYRYQKYISDIAGQDIRAHGNRADKLIGIVRDWLRSAESAQVLPGGAEIASRYARFRKDLPGLCAALKWKPVNLPYVDYMQAIWFWLQEKAREARSRGTH